MKRFCTHLHRHYGFETQRHPANLSVGTPAGKAEHAEWHPSRSRCAGTCDDDIGICFCPSHTKYGRIPAPPDAPPGSPPVRLGRPMGNQCQPNKTEDGTPTDWGSVDPELLFGPQGWCTAEQPAIRCDCQVDGLGGGYCEDIREQTCFNQCNGRGECKQGYCKCDKGWHGIDCAHRSTYADVLRPGKRFVAGREVDRPWIAPHVHTPAARQFLPGETRKRPLIYVYDLPSEYSTLMLQYRHSVFNCVPRFFEERNTTILSPFTYTVESGFLEALLQSEHRTLNPEEADFFYVPVMPSCFMSAVRASTDSVYDFFYGWVNNRASGAVNMLLEAFHWIRAHHPYWDRRGGRDHIWLVSHDEGSCLVPSAIRSSVIFSHWGRKDANHTSGTGYGGDNYSIELKHPQWEPDGVLWKLGKHPCYEPEKDLVVPLMKTPNHFHRSPLLGAPARNRTWLAFHRGRVQFNNPSYSRGIRQRLAKASKENDWLDKYRMAVGDYDNVQGDYSELLASSVFCLVIPGDGWSARMDDAVLHGCIPVIIMDEVHVSFENIIDLSQFTLRVAEKDAERLPEILAAVSEERRKEMQLNLAKVWHRFSYSSYRLYSSRMRELQKENAQRRSAAAAEQGGQPASLPHPVEALDPEADDAFATIMGFLHSRIPFTR